MNLRKQVEPLKKAALQASSLQRHAHHAASRLTWMKRWLKRAYRHHAQSRELKHSKDLSPRALRVQGSGIRVSIWDGEPPRLQATPSGGLRYAGRPWASIVEPAIRCMRATTISCSSRSIASRCFGATSESRCAT